LSHLRARDLAHSTPNAIPDHGFSYGTRDGKSYFRRLGVRRGAAEAKGCKIPAAHANAGLIDLFEFGGSKKTAFLGQ
jgi:hypothetical protein